MHFCHVMDLEIQRTSLFCKHLASHPPQVLFNLMAYFFFFNIKMTVLLSTPCLKQLQSALPSKFVATQSFCEHLRIELGKANRGFPIHSARKIASPLLPVRMQVKDFSHLFLPWEPDPKLNENKRNPSIDLSTSGNLIQSSSTNLHGKLDAAWGQSSKPNLHPLPVASGTHSCSHTPPYLQELPTDGCWQPRAPSETERASWLTQPPTRTWMSRFWAECVILSIPPSYLQLSGLELVHSQPVQTCICLYLYTQHEI